jgi:hypothetical protein
MTLSTIKVEERAEDGDTIFRYMPATRRGGTWVRFGLEEFRLPALGLHEVQELDGDVKLLDGMERGASPTREQWAAAHRIIWASMRRNYPDIEVADVVPLIDLSNVNQVLNAIFGISGYARAQPGEARPNP